MYEKTVGVLRYLTECTVYEINLPVHALARASRVPTHRHSVALKRLVRYVNTTKYHSILFPKSKPPLITYADADYTEENDI